MFIRMSICRRRNGHQNGYQIVPILVVLVLEINTTQKNQTMLPINMISLKNFLASNPHEKHVPSCVPAPMWIFTDRCTLSHPDYIHSFYITIQTYPSNNPRWNISQSHPADYDGKLTMCLSLLRLSTFMKYWRAYELIQTWSFSVLL